MNTQTAAQRWADEQISIKSRSRVVITLDAAAAAAAESLTFDGMMCQETRKPLPQSMNLSRAWAKPVPTFHAR